MFIYNFKFLLFSYVINLLIIISILLFYLNGNDDMTLHIMLGGFESIKLIAYTDPP